MSWRNLKGVTNIIGYKTYVLDLNTTAGLVKFIDICWSGQLLILGQSIPEPKTPAAIPLPRYFETPPLGKVYVELE